MEDVIVRKATIKDVNRIADIKIEGWQTAYRGILEDAFLDNMNRDVEISKRKDDIENENNIFVAEVEGNIVAFCLYRDYIKDTESYPNYDCEISSLYVTNNFKRKGIGKKLMKKVIKYLKEQGKSKMILGCLKDNYPSRAFYEKMGGKIIKIDQIEFGNKKYDLAIYEYNIAEI